MIFLNSPRFAAAGPYVTTAADYDGTNDWMERNAIPANLANNDAGVVSFWIRPDTTGALQRLWHNSGARHAINRGTDGKIRFFGKTTGNSIILDMFTAGVISTGVFTHVAAAWDLSAGIGQVFVGGVSSRAGSPTLINGTVQYSNVDVAIGAAIGGSNKFDGGLTEFYWDDKFLDLPTNIGKFIQAGKPIDLGSTGQLPSGTTPVMYFRNGRETNDGNGGNFTVFGVLGTRPNSPTD